jgi:hypothetical protein
MDNNHWSDEIEDICEKLRVNCVNLSEYHRKRFYHFKSYGKWFRLPLIVLASINSTASVGLQPVLEQQIISGITCLIGMIMGIIGSLELYLGIQAAMELELKQSKDFYTLAIHLYKTLALKRENRLEDGKEYLNDKYSFYIKLCESSNLLDKRMKSDLLAKVPENTMDKTGSEGSTPRLHDLDELDHSKFSITIPNEVTNDSPIIRDIEKYNEDHITKAKEVIANLEKSKSVLKDYDSIRKELIEPENEIIIHKEGVISQGEEIITQEEEEIITQGEEIINQKEVLKGKNMVDEI